MKNMADLDASPRSPCKSLLQGILAGSLSVPSLAPPQCLYLGHALTGLLPVRNWAQQRSQGWIISAQNKTPLTDNHWCRDSHQPGWGLLRETLQSQVLLNSLFFSPSLLSQMSNLIIILRISSLLLILPSLSFTVTYHKLFIQFMKEMGIPDHLTCLLRNLHAGQETQQLEMDMEQQTGSKLGKEYIKAVSVTLLI